LQCRLVPVLQGYCAYTELLDELDAKFFEDEGAPRTVILDFPADFSSIDGRSPWFETPRTWRALLSRYRFIRVDPTQQRALLAREERKAPPPPPREVARQRIPMRVWTNLPAGSTRPLLSLKLQLTARGRFEKFFFRVPEVMVEWRTQSGHIDKARIVPETAAAGLFVADIPRSIEELALVTDGKAVDPVLSFRVDGPGADAYGPDFEAIWHELLQ
jgi:hypothetical protein